MLTILVASGSEGLTEEVWRDLSRSNGAIGGDNPYRAFREARDALLRKGSIRKEGDRFAAI